MKRRPSLSLALWMDRRRLASATHKRASQGHSTTAAGNIESASLTTAPTVTERFLIDHRQSSACSVTVGTSLGRPPGTWGKAWTYRVLFFGVAGEAVVGELSAWPGRARVRHASAPKQPKHPYFLDKSSRRQTNASPRHVPFSCTLRVASLQS